MRVSSRVIALCVLAATVVVGLAACFPEPYEQVGKRCDAVLHACGEGLFCVEGRCSEDPPRPNDPGDAGADAGSFDAGDDGGAPDASETDGGAQDAGYDAGPPPNLLLNPDFEAAMPDGGRPPAWKPAGAATLSTEYLQTHSGLQAARVVSTQMMGVSTSVLLPTVAPVDGPGTDRYCAKVWVFVATDGGDIPKLNFREFDRTAPFNSATAVFAGTKRDEWELLRGSYTAQGLEALEIRVTQSSASVGEGFVADDADLWRSADCSER